MIRLTRAGVLVTAGGVALIALGRVFGLFELFIVGTSALALTTVSAIGARRRRPLLTVSRAVGGRRVHAGGQVSVRVVAGNAGSGSTPVILLTDPVQRRAARLLVAPLAPSQETSSDYLLSVARRGRLAIGPMTAAVVDPFGLARAEITAAPTAEVLVLPRVEGIPAPPRTPAVEAVSGQSGSQGALLGAGGEFHSLSTYRPGDDLRRVHWPTSMRRGDLMIRNNEQPWDGVTTVVLDDSDSDGGASTSADGFETAVTAAASIAAAAIRARHRVRLLTAGGWDSGFGSGAAHGDRILRQLALVERRPSRLGTALTLAGRHGGAVAVVSPNRIDRVSCTRQLSAAGVVVLVAPGLDVAPGPDFSARWTSHTLHARIPAAAP